MVNGIVRDLNRNEQISLEANQEGVCYPSFKKADRVANEICRLRQLGRVDLGGSPVTGNNAISGATASRGYSVLSGELRAKPHMETQSKVAGWLRSFCFYRGNDRGTRGLQPVSGLPGNVYEDNRDYNQRFASGPFWNALKQHWAGNFVHDYAIGKTGIDNLAKGRYGVGAYQMGSGFLGRMIFHACKAVVATSVMVVGQTARVVINAPLLVLGAVADLGAWNIVRWCDGDPVLNPFTWDGAHTFFNRYDALGTMVRIMSNEIEPAAAVKGREEGGTKDMLVALATQYADGNHDEGLQAFTGRRAREGAIDEPVEVWGDIRKMLCDPDPPKLKDLRSAPLYGDGVNQWPYFFGAGAKTAKRILDENRLGYSALQKIAYNGGDALDVIGVMNGKTGFVTSEDPDIRKVNGRQGTVQILAALRTRYRNRQLDQPMDAFKGQTATEYIKNKTSLTRGEVQMILDALDPPVKPSPDPASDEARPAASTNDDRSLQEGSSAEDSSSEDSNSLQDESSAEESMTPFTTSRDPREFNRVEINQREINRVNAYRRTVLHHLESICEPDHLNKKMKELGKKTVIDYINTREGLERHHVNHVFEVLHKRYPKNYKIEVCSSS